MNVLISSCSTILFILAIFGDIQCQIHYVPVQVLVPTYNGTHLTNHSIYNNAPPQPPAVYNNYNNGRPSSYNQTYNNSLNNGTSDGHLFVGTIGIYDRLLFDQVYFKERHWWKNREKILEYPKDLPAGYSRHETISAIRIYNRFYDGNSARAVIEDGGIGRQFVKIRMYSKWGYGFRYQVKIYGR